LILTWPNEIVDPVLSLLHRIGLISDAMESEKHERRIPKENLLVYCEGLGLGGSPITHLNLA